MLRPTTSRVTDGQRPLVQTLAEGHIVEAAFRLQRQQGEASHDLTRNHASIVSLRYAMLIIYSHME